MRTRVLWGSGVAINTSRLSWPFLFDGARTGSRVSRPGRSVPPSAFGETAVVFVPWFRIFVIGQSSPWPVCPFRRCAARAARPRPGGRGPRHGSAGNSAALDKAPSYSKPALEVGEGRRTGLEWFLTPESEREGRARGARSTGQRGIVGIVTPQFGQCTDVGLRGLLASGVAVCDSDVGLLIKSRHSSRAGRAPQTGPRSSPKFRPRRTYSPNARTAERADKG